MWNVMSTNPTQMFAPLPSFLPLPLTVADEVNPAPRPDMDAGKARWRDRLGSAAAAAAAVTLSSGWRDPGFTFPSSLRVIEIWAPAGGAGRELPPLQRASSLAVANVLLHAANSAIFLKWLRPVLLCGSLRAAGTPERPPTSGHRSAAPVT